MPVLVRPGQRESVQFVLGHVWGRHIDAWAKDPMNAPPVEGPEPARVMVIGKMPGSEEVQEGRNFVGPSGEVLNRALDAVGCRGRRSWYVTNFIKFRPPDGIVDLRAEWVQMGKHLLSQELRVVRPDYILCLGADAAKAVLGPSATVQKMDGRVEEFEYDATVDPSEPARKTALVMAVVHPAQVAREPSLGRSLERNLGRFTLLLKGVRPDAPETDVDHRVVDNVEDLEALLAEIDADPEKTDRVIACDAEWHGDHLVNKGAYLRLFQFAWKPKHAACVVLRAAGGESAFLGRDGKPDPGEAMRVLSNWFQDKRVVGHFFNADLEWLVDSGLDLRKQFEVPRYDADDGTPAWARTRTEGGADTGLMAHAIEETSTYGLETLTMRYCPGVPRYDLPVAEWVKKQKQEFGVLEGYGDCPDETLIPYACLHGSSLVQLSDGRWEKISTLVSSKYSGCVKAFHGGKVVDAQVIGWHRKSVNQREWFRLRTAGSKSNGAGWTGPVFTPDHKVLTQRGKVRVDELVVGTDGILTEEREFTRDQLSVFLGSLLGDGGFCRARQSGVGFKFGQAFAREAYADWKADVFSRFDPSRGGDETRVRYRLPCSRYLKELSRRFPTKTKAQHSDCKAVITAGLLDSLGDLGLAVWYQDDGTLVSGNRSWIYCQIDEEEQKLVVDWLAGKFGEGVAYNPNGGYLRFSGESFDRFHAAIAPFMHPSVSYKSPLPVTSPPVVDKDGDPYYDKILEVVSRGEGSPAPLRGARFCLTVAVAGNFLTKAGFVSNCYDADATLRLFYTLDPLLDCDYDGNCCREAFWESMFAAPAVLEIHRNGIAVDKGRIDELSVAFVDARSRLEKEVQAAAAWDTFNIRSAFHVREFLYGSEYSGKYDKEGNPVSVRSPGARSLGLRPILDTSKPPRLWSDLVLTGQEKGRTPSTNKAVLPQLIAANPGVRDEIGLVRDYRVIDQVLKSVLRPPKNDPEGAYLRDEDTGLVYDAGLAVCICDDGRVRTHIYQTKETGRWSSARPPLQNISKTRDRDYKRLLGDRYKHNLRSIFKASPGHLFVEADYRGAELFGAAVMAGDDVMLDHARRANLPDEGYDEHGKEAKGGKHPHPDYYDIHSNVAVLAFRLDCAPTKLALKAADLSHFRTLAKRTLFGLMYGQGAASSAMLAREEGIDVTVEEAQAVIDAILETYPGLVPFFEECRRRATEDRWLCHCFGRFRRFPYSADRKLLGEFERQAMNFPVQGMIASAVSRAIGHLVRYRDDVGVPDMYRVLLQIHDAILIEVPYEHLAFVVDEVVPYCMRDLVPIYPTSLDGVPTGKGPYHLGFEAEVSEHWGEHLTRERCSELGVPARFGK